MRAIALTGLVFLLASAADAKPRCDPSLRHRTAAEVMESHRAALSAGDWETARCNYAPDAVVINDGGVTEGRDAIIGQLQFLGSLFGGLIPSVTQEVVVSILNDRAEMVRLLFTISTQCLDIPDGVDTYIVKNGQIQAQTAHGFPVFKCGPPPG
ncbi:MAG: nuclear transport factor 2 family protein [Deltaproteobacteria bacterium]|nr:nuclear transport factor 2 family protein [Deltaproteobacteria bacterium]